MLCVWWSLLSILFAQLFATGVLIFLPFCLAIIFIISDLTWPAYFFVPYLFILIKKRAEIIQFNTIFLQLKITCHIVIHNCPCGRPTATATVHQIRCSDSIFWVWRDFIGHRLLSQLPRYGRARAFNKHDVMLLKRHYFLRRAVQKM